MYVPRIRWPLDAWNLILNQQSGGSRIYHTVVTYYFWHGSLVIKKNNPCRLSFAVYSLTMVVKNTATQRPKILAGLYACRVLPVNYKLWTLHWTRKHFSGMRASSFSDLGGDLPEEAPWKERGTRDRDSLRRHMGPGSLTGSDILQRPPPHGQTDTCESITLSQTSFAGGNYVKWSIFHYSGSHVRKLD